MGGAKDIGGFRSNIKAGLLPMLEAITPEGLFFEYYFDTGKADEEVPQETLFYPSYQFAASPGFTFHQI